MAVAKAKGYIGAALGAGLSLTAAAFPAAAQDSVRAAMSLETVDTILCETDREYFAKDGWTSEGADLSCASDAARDYAENNPGVGVLIHVGTESFGEGKRFATPEAFGEAVVQTFEGRFGVSADYFLSQNDAPATVLTYHIGDLIHGADNGTEVKTVREALEAMPEVASYVELIWEEKLAAAQQLQNPTPFPNNN